MLTKRAHPGLVATATAAGALDAVQAGAPLYYSTTVQAATHIAAVGPLTGEEASPLPHTVHDM
jgi:hypothetical protein